MGGAKWQHPSVAKAGPIRAETETANDFRFKMNARSSYKREHATTYAAIFLDTKTWKLIRVRHRGTPRLERVATRTRQWMTHQAYWLAIFLCVSEAAHVVPVLRCVYRIINVRVRVLLNLWYHSIHPLESLDEQGHLSSVGSCQQRLMDPGLLLQHNAIILSSSFIRNGTLSHSLSDSLKRSIRVCLSTTVPKLCQIE